MLQLLATLGLARAGDHFAPRNRDIAHDDNLLLAVALGRERALSNRVAIATAGHLLVAMDTFLHVEPPKNI